MCGIAGIVRTSRAPVEQEILERMCEAQAHRGPDSRGLHVEDEVGLGIQRLRVIDLQTGDQPIYNEDGSVVVVLNGEIYNFRELRPRPAASRPSVRHRRATPRSSSTSTRRWARVRRGAARHVRPRAVGQGAGAISPGS